MQRDEEPRQHLALVRVRRREVGRDAVEPGRDAPRIGIAERGLADPALGIGCRQRQARRHHRQPGLCFVDDQLGGDRAAGQAQRQIIAQPQHRVVPAVLRQLDRQVGQIRMLIAQQRTRQLRRHLEIG